jgi:hypothetical protein
MHLNSLVHTEWGHHFIQMDCIGTQRRIGLDWSYEYSSTRLDGNVLYVGGVDFSKVQLTLEGLKFATSATSPRVELDETNYHDAIYWRRRRAKYNHSYQDER